MWRYALLGSHGRSVNTGCLPSLDWTSGGLDYWTERDCFFRCTNGIEIVWFFLTGNVPLANKASLPGSPVKKFP